VNVKNSDPKLEMGLERRERLFSTTTFAIYFFPKYDVLAILLLGMDTELI